MAKMYKSRSKSNLNLGIINKTNKKVTEIYRRSELNEFDKFYDCKQYEDKNGWDDYNSNGVYVPVRNRAPRFKFAFAKTLAQRVTAKLIGKSVFPTFEIVDSEIDTEYLKAIIKNSKIKTELIEPVKRMLNCGSSFLRFYLEDGAFVFKRYDSKYVYPTRTKAGNLESVEVKYTYKDKEDLKPDGSPTVKWYKIQLNKTDEILFDNPEYEEGEEPEFKVVDRVIHDVGFVQGVWLSTCKEQDCPDGPSIIKDIMPFIDEFNYNLSQSSQAIAYNQEPQLTFKGMTQDEVDQLVTSSTKSWSLGREGSAEFVESTMRGVEAADNFRTNISQGIQDVTRVVMLDPEKIIGSAQSAKAMEVLYGPLVELIDEIREPVGDIIKELVLKLALLNFISFKKGMPVPIEMPPTYRMSSLNVELTWPPIFQKTMEDLQRKMGVASSATSANIISRETATKWIAKDFDIENVEEETAKIDAQPVINPFGGF